MRKTTEKMWLHRVSPLGLAGALMLPLMLNGADAADKSGTENGHEKLFQDNHTAVTAEFEAVENERRAALRKAADGDYRQSVTDLEKASAKLAKFSGDLAVKKRDEIANNITRIKGVWSSDLMKEARKFASRKQYKEAIAKAQEAQLLTPSREYIASFVTECQKAADAGQYRQDVAPSRVTPDLESRNKQIDILMREAKLFMRNKRYETAGTHLERILLLDPFNVEAVQLLAGIYDRLYRAGLDRAGESRDLTNARAFWEWVGPVRKVASESARQQIGKERTQSNVDLYNTLERIVFPSVPLKTATVKQVISYLNEKSRAYDPKKEGVTIIDNLSPAEKARKISFELGKMPLLDIIRYFSMASGLPYSLNNNRVIFGDVDNMSTEYFPVRGDIIAEIIETAIPSQAPAEFVTNEGGGGGGDGAPEDETVPVLGGDEAAATTETPAAGGNSDSQRISAALKSYFSERWITFDNGANIVYRPRAQVLAVRNTPENLRRMDFLLRQLNALEQPMILVEAKMIELTDTNLNELGFEWTFSAERTAGNRWSLGTTDPTRHGDGENMFRVLNNLKIFPNFGEKIFGSDLNVDLSLSINAVAQNEMTEVLSSPKILSISGPKSPAKIEVFNETYFITEWEEPEIETDGMSTKMTTTQPDWDEARKLGVTFEVTPAVDTNNRTITLNNVHPKFEALVAEHSNPMVYESGIINERGEKTPLSRQVFDLKMPEFAVREINTNITLFDGETVLIGGVSDNEASNRDDRWPLLGDIPLIGNLFRDQQKKSVNHTLLIFITARLVNSQGAPWKPQNLRNHGLVDFNR